MKKTEFKIEARCKVSLEHTDGEATSKFLQSDMLLELHGPLDRKKYFDREGLPNENGCQALTMAFLSGLANNIHFAHEKGYRDSAEHLRYIISKLEEQFISVPKISKGDFDE